MECVHLIPAALAIIFLYWITGVYFIDKYFDAGKYDFIEAFFWPILAILFLIKCIIGGFRQLLAHIGDVFAGEVNDK